MPEITVIGNDGEPVSRHVRSTRFGINVDGSGMKFPAATQVVEVEKDGNVEQTGTQCGTMRQENVASDPFAVRVECIITTEGDAVLDDALTVRDVLHRIDEGEAVTINSAYPIERPLTVRNIVVIQNTDVISVNTDQTDGDVLAFECQLQLGAESNE